MRLTHGRITSLTVVMLALAGAAIVFGPSCGRGGGGGGGSLPSPDAAVDPAPAPGPNVPAVVPPEVTATGVKGRFAAGSATPQSLTAPAGSPVEGVTLTIPAGALAADTEIAIDAATGATAGRIADGYGLDGVAVAVGAAIQLTATPPIAPSAPMALTLRGASVATLTEAALAAVVLYDAAAPATGTFALQGASVAVAGADVIAQATGFGRYQAILFAADAAPSPRRLAVRGTPIMSPPLVGSGARVRASSPVLSPARTAGSSKLEHEGVGP